LSPNRRHLKNVILCSLSSGSVIIDTVTTPIPFTLNFLLGVYIHHGTFIQIRSLNETNCSSAHAFGNHKQNHFKHNSIVCERNRCCTSTFVMIMVQMCAGLSTHCTEVSCTNFPNLQHASSSQLLTHACLHSSSFFHDAHRRPPQQRYDGCLRNF